MHLLAGEAGRIDDGEEANDLAQPPGDIVVLSSADSELAALAAAAREAGTGGLRLANLMRLAHPLSVDLFVDKTVAGAKLVVVRLMGGLGYWPHGVERLRALARRGGPRLVVVPGEDRWDDAVEALSTVPAADCRRLWSYLVEGGPENARRALAFMNHLIGGGPAPAEPAVLARAGCYWPGERAVSLDDAVERLDQERPVAPIVFYRSILQGGATAPVEALAAALDREGIAALPVYVASLKDGDSATFLRRLFAEIPPAIVLNTTAFSVASAGTDHRGTVLDRPGRPVLQVVLATSTEEAWRASPRDLVMHVVLPEVDGRLLTRAVSFKEERLDPLLYSRIATYAPVADRVDFVARLAAAWVRLGGKPAKDRRIALVLSNYPNRDGRIANGVGLDTPESAARLAAAMKDAGYAIAGFPETGAGLMAEIAAGETNDLSQVGERAANVVLPLAAYRRFFESLPQEAQAAVTDRWGRPEDDAFFGGGGFRLAMHRFGNVAVGIQPSRGYDLDAKASCHDPALVPPHRDLAFYAWLREEFAADAVVHLGKHGNLEWLPGKALGLAATCWPELALGPTPLVYPFIVNDPGEGAQAKRRSSATIVDHLMPAMTRAETYGPLAELETLIDEYCLAAGMDRRRRDHLRREILATAARNGLDRDLGFDGSDEEMALTSLDAHLCDLKEMQIRDGLHILGTPPTSRQRTDTLAAIARVPRSGTRDADRSLHRAIAADLALAFDPLDCQLAAPWTGPRPGVLAFLSDAPWRTAGDTVERIEALAAALVAGEAAAPGPESGAVLAWIEEVLAPALDRSGDAETAAALAALDGRFVAPGPSGAPTRGRPEVLPTGRNFYSVDVRAVPTEAAWALGRQAAEALALRYFQDEGEWPKAIALSAWATANMRTGGDDIAEAMALIGARPVWEPGTGRVTGFAVLPLSELGRPRIDVTLKISGMFRDAFPVQIDLLDSAVRAIAALDEDEDANPIAAAARATAAALAAQGLSAAASERAGATRIFGARPGAYGAGMQAMIDGGVWATRGDFATVFLEWGSFAYSGGAEGTEARDLLAERLRRTDAVLHNQDNREHDILDSDDYYQFQGGLAATVEALKGMAPRVYHGDHSRPEKAVVRSLAEEVARVVRGRAANRKWIAGMMRHGYKGAFEMAATVDYLFAYAALTDAVGDHHFDQLFDAYVGDATVRAFIAGANPAALREIAARLREAVDRGLWSPRSNSAYDRLSALADIEKEAAE
jgi:cobaltochelatase CobN